jgi:iron complex transport system permease protein
MRSPSSEQLSGRPLIAALLIAVLLAAWFELRLGAMPTHPVQVLRALAAPFAAGTSPEAEPVTRTVLQLRLPRLVLGLLVGATLAICGAVMQGLFRNPLADPGLVGVSGGAAAGAAASVVLTGSLLLPQWLARLATPLGAFVGAALAASAVLAVARRNGRTSIASLLLAGLAINAISGAAIGFLLAVADPAQLRSITFWLFGSLGRAGWPEIAVVAPILALLLGCLSREARALDALLLGDAEAQHLGIDVAALRRRLLLMIVIAVGCAVSVTGLIGFVGLLVPHGVRLLRGAAHRRLLPAAALAGAALLCVADLAARLLFAPVEMPIGILTATIGGAFFLFLLVRRGHEGHYG